MCRERGETFQENAGPENFYRGLQVLYGEPEALTEKERLFSAVGPLLCWYEKRKRDLPWRRDKDPYHIWISEIMLQQTRVEAVKPYYARFMEQFPTVEALAMGSEEVLLKCWEGLGYYSRARNLKKAAEIIKERYGGKFPGTYEEILSLPGIGSYTAGAIGSIAFSLPVPAVDGNVLRVLSRVFGSREDILKQSTKRRMENLAGEVLRESKAAPGEFNQALIETGALLCIPNGEPLCKDCPFYTVCAAREQNLTGELPVKQPKKKRKTEEKTVLLLEVEDKIAIRKRDGDGLLASLYEFPSLPGRLKPEAVVRFLEGGGAEGSRKESAGLERIRAEEIQELPAAKHIFSHVEWHMNGCLLRLKGLPENETGAEFFSGLLFVTWEECREKYPIPNAFMAYKKILDERYGGKKQ